MNQRSSETDIGAWLKATERWVRRADDTSTAGLRCLLTPRLWNPTVVEPL